MSEQGFGERLKLIRQKLGLKQKELAKKLEVSNAAISEIENEKYKPGHDFIYLLSDKLNISLDYIFFGRGEIFSEPKKQDQHNELDADLLKLVWYCQHSDFMKHYMLAYFYKTLGENKAFVEKNLKPDSVDPKQDS